MLGVIVNTVAVVLGSLLGLGGKGLIPKKLSNAVMTGLGLCVVAIGISGIIEEGNTLITIGAMVIGAIIGTLLNIDGALNRLGQRLETKTPHDGKTSIAQGFVTASLLFCVGAMTIVGSLNAGLYGDNDILFAKSLLDLISSTMLSATLGIGVMFAAVMVLLFQGLIVLLAGFLQPILTDMAIVEITRAGSLLILGLGLNMLDLTKIKVADYLPAIVIAPLICWIVSWINSLL